MAPKIFATGATGFIGGTALDTIIKAHPEYEITALVRDKAKAEKVKAQFPNVRIAFGDLDSADIIKEECSKVDIVLHFADCDHVPSANAITSTLAANPKQTFLIHTSGSAILPDVSKPELFGTPVTEEESYNDVTDIEKITTWPIDGHLHRDVDVVVIQGTPEHVKTAVVCPCTIYGQGTGPVNRQSLQVPQLTLETLKRGKGFTVNRGKNTWNQVHVRDLADLYLKLTEAAAKGGEGADWNEQGYYFAENGEFLWGDIAALIAKKAKARGLIKTDELDHLSHEEVIKFKPFGAIAWGTNSKGTAQRARERLGWKPTREPIEDTIDAVLDDQAKVLGL